MKYFDIFSLVSPILITIYWYFKELNMEKWSVTPPQVYKVELKSQAGKTANTICGGVYNLSGLNPTNASSPLGKVVK